MANELFRASPQLILKSQTFMAVTPEQLYEQTLVIRSQLGDESAFTELLQRHGPRLLRFTERMLQSAPPSIADVSQEIWVAIFRALPRLTDPARFGPWAFRIARDRIYQEYRRRKIRAESTDEIPDADLAEAADRITADDAAALHHCLGSISPEHREALVLRFLEDMSYDEIARATGTSVGTIRSRIHYGKRALRAAWEAK
jgi:RNA polymerase sigma-70 factor (ECF subfamily)